MPGQPKQLQYSQINKLAKAKTREYDITSSFPLGYRNREDVTNMNVLDSTSNKLVYSPSVMVKGSQNVLTNIGERIGIRKGYTLYGQENTAIGGITGSYDWNRNVGSERHLRVNSNAGTLEYSYTDPTTSAVTWNTLASGFTANPNFQFAPLFNVTEATASLLMVNGTSNIYDWSGGEALVASTTNSSGFVTGVEIAPDFSNPGGQGYTVGDIITIANVGGIDQLSLSAGGSSYTAGDTGTIVGGGGSGATFRILTLSGSAVATVQILQSGINYTQALGTGIAVATVHSGGGGSGYSVGNVLTVANGSGGTVTVATISGSAVATVTITTPGTSYVTSTAVPTTGAGTGCTLDITSGVTFTTLLGGSGGYLNFIVGQAHGNNDATATVTSVDGSGAITGLTLASPGTGYTAINGYTVTGGTGGGAVLEVTSIASNSITISGTQTIPQLGFYVLVGTSGKTLVINGTTYTYQYAQGSTFYGIGTDPTGIAVGSLIVQGLITTSNSAIAGLPVTPPFNNDLIGNLNEQIFLGSLSSNTVYVSKINTYKDFTFSAPRIPGDGAVKQLQGNCVGFIQLEGDMYISSGTDFWYVTQFTSYPQTVNFGDFTISGVLETLNFIQLKTSILQGAQNQSCMSKLQNQIIYMSHEPAFDSFGLVSNILEITQILNMSESIKLDFDLYDLTDCTTFYYRNFIYISIPREGIVRIYNIARSYWEAPQILPIRYFAVIDGELYGHDYNVPQTYKLFSGYSDNGYAVNAKAVFAFNNLDVRFALKNENAFYVEGYITENTNLTLNLQYDLDGIAVNRNFTLNGSNTQFVALQTSDASLGKTGLGKSSLGGTTDVTDSESLPPKFRWIPTFTKLDFFEKQVSFSSTGVGQNWQLLAYGGNTGISDAEPVYLKQ